MPIRFVTPALHGIVDYLAGIALIVVPRLLGLGDSSPYAMTLWTAVGVAAIISALLTNYHLGLFKLVPYKLHLMVDLSVAALFAIAPALFDLKGPDMWFTIANAVALVAVVFISQREADPENPGRWR